MFKKYIDYLKDNPKNLWFKRKLYGWGWTPVRWQGWAVVLIFIGFIIWNGVKLAPNPEPTGTMLTWFFVKTIIAIALLLIICYKKGEKPRWQWGLPHKDDQN